MKIKISEYTDQYMDLAREQQRLLIVVVTLKMIPKGLEKRLDKLETTALLGSIIILRTVPKNLKKWTNWNSEEKLRPSR